MVKQGVKLWPVIFLVGCSLNDPPGFPPAIVYATETPLPRQKPTAPKPPFELETLFSPDTEFTATIPPLQPVPEINPEHLFQLIYRCFPAKSKFDISVKLKAGANLLENTPVDLTAENLSPLSNYYVGVVANMPLWSNDEETDRQRHREHQRRTQLSTDISTFIAALAERNTAERQLGLYLALEQRSQYRIRLGLAPVPEQVDYLEKVILAKEALIKAQAKITQSQLALVGQCGADRTQSVHQYLTSLVAKANNP